MHDVYFTFCSKIIYKLLLVMILNKYILEVKALIN